MQKTTALALAAAIAVVGGSANAKGSSSKSRSSSSSGSSSHSVHGYVKKDGTYVAPHHATNPNSSKHDNYSSKGNTNPYTGKEGTKDPNK